MNKINQKQVLGLEERLSRLEKQKAESRQFVLKSGDEIRGDVDITGTLITTNDFMVSGETFFANGNRIETYPNPDGVDSGVGLKISSNDLGEPTILALEKDVDGSGTLFMGMGAKIWGGTPESDFVFDSPTGFLINLTGDNKLEARNDGIYFKDAFQTNNILIEDFDCFVANGSLNKKIDEFSSRTTFFREYDLILYSKNTGIGIEIGLSKKDGDSRVSVYPEMGTMSGISFTSDYGFGELSLFVSNSCEDVWIKGLTKSYMREYEEFEFESLSSASSESSSMSSMSSMSSSQSSESSLSSSMSSSESSSSASSDSSESSSQSSSSQSSSASSDSSESSDQEYDFLFERDFSTKRTANIIGYIGEGGDVIIPSVVYRTYSVTGIGGGAFAYETGITNVFIPDSVTGIGTGAFLGCSGISGVRISENCGYIGNSAFNSCVSLTGISIPDSVESLGNRAFYKCTGLAYVDIGDGVTGIDAYTMALCSSLSELIIPDKVESIGYGAFQFSAISEVEIGTGTRLIRDMSFYNCSRLTGIIVNGHAPFVSGEYAFTGATGATVYYYCQNTGFSGSLGGIPTQELCYYDYTILDDRTIIEQYTGIEQNVSIPDYFKGYPTTEIAADAFRENDTMRCISMPSSITGIGDRAFWLCSQLTGIEFPDLVETMSESVIQQCPNLVSVTLGTGMKTIEDVACALNGSIVRLSIPDGVTHIGEEAFIGLSGMQTLVFGTGIDYIGYYSFEDCTGLMEIFFNGSEPETVEGDAFTNVNPAAIVLYRCENSGFYGDWNGFTTVPICDFRYYIDDESLFITGYNGTGGNVVIPNTLEGYVPYKLQGFRQEGTIFTVSIPSGLHELADYTFSGSLNLTGVIFRGEPPATGAYPLRGMSEDTKVYYLDGATGWTGEFGGYPTECLDCT